MGERIAYAESDVRAWRWRLRRRLWRRNPHCSYCGKRIRLRTATLDHIVPLSQGGQDEEGNLALACRPCNQAKGSRTVGEWVDDLLHGPPCIPPPGELAEACADIRQHWSDEEHWSRATAEAVPVTVRTAKRSPVV